MFGFTAFEVHEDVVACEDSFCVRSIASVSFSLTTLLLAFKHSVLELVDNTPEMFEVNVLKSPTRPEVAGDEVVLVGEFENSSCSECPSSHASEGNAVFCSNVEETIVLLVTDECIFSGDLLEEELLGLESVGSGNSSR